MNFSEFQECLKAYSPGSIVFVGLGNPVRSDDAAGLILLEKIRQKPPFSHSHFIQAGTNPENFLQTILDCHPEAVVFIDTAHFNESPGTIEWLNRKDLDQTRFSTHAFSMTLVEDYLRTNQLMDFHYLGIQPYSTKMGEGISTIVKKKLEQFFCPMVITSLL